MEALFRTVSLALALSVLLAFTPFTAEAAGSCALLQATQDGTDAASYTFSTQNLGTAAADRYIIVTGASRALASNVLSSITVGGNAVTLDVNFPRADAATRAWVGHALVTTGTTGDVVLTFAGTQRRVGIALYRCTGLTSATPIDTGSSEAAPLTAGGLDFAAGGWAVGICGTADTSSATWVGLTEDFDTAWAPGPDGTYSGASILTPTLSPTQTVTCTWASSNIPVAAFASWNLDDTSALPDDQLIIFE